MTSRIVTNMTFYHLDQLWFSTLSCIISLSWSRIQGPYALPGVAEDWEG